ncbi:hypothetical protein [Micromonospora sp. RTP1Z1]|uniref:hypothetical protein n=1 Tax=Micromonospora sp. RTP1Z1 TaxID=2994043 RepID=UPI0029C9335C|nr:hypothetical protein [Micromonospora sp. RTP1Z1]
MGDAAGTVTARLLVAGPMIGGTQVTAFPGRFLVDRRFVLTAVAIPVSDRAGAPAEVRLNLP